MTSRSSLIIIAGNVILLIINIQVTWSLAQIKTKEPVVLSESPHSSYSKTVFASASADDIIDSFPDSAALPNRDAYLLNAAERQGSAATEKTSTEISGNSSSVEFDGRAVGVGTLLEEFQGSKLSTAGEASNVLPIFLTEPESIFVVKNRPAVLKCKASHALQVLFKCSGSTQPPPSTHDKHVDPHTGVHMEEVTAIIHRDLVDEYFGKGPFKCECQAWSSRGVVKSQAATVTIAYIRKSFNQTPTSLRIEIGSRAELHCESPGGFPEPKIAWLKNNIPIATETEAGIIVAGGSLTIHQAALPDMANYTCSAENVAGKRISDSAVLIVYVNGGWTSWSSWRECKCSGKSSMGRRRTRTCTNPMPLNGGAQCTGPQMQKSTDCASCPEDTQIVSTDGFDISSSKRMARWSAWSEWSVCSVECIQVRRRKCLAQSSLAAELSDDVSEQELGAGMAAFNSGSSGSDVDDGGTIGIRIGKSLCAGKDFQTAECRGEQCQIGKNDFDWTLYLGLAFIASVCFAFGAALICCARRGIRSNPHYNIARSALDADYIPGVVDKKEMRIHMEAANLGYDYVNPGHPYLPGEHIVVSAVCPGGVTEHHYDVPNLAANYTSPIDDLSGDYLSEAGESSTVDTSNNSTFDMNAKFSLLSTSLSTTYELLGSGGGRLRLYNGELLLFVPELAIGKHLKKHVSLMLISDESSRIAHATENSMLCSSVVHSAPRNYSFIKPAILKIPHCLVMAEQWHVHVYHADNEYDDLNVNWRRVVTVGEETINTPMFVQMEMNHVYIMTEQLGHFAVVAEPRVQHAGMKMKLIAFSQLTPSSAISSLRIYVVKDFPNSKDICNNVESKLGGNFMGESSSFVFVLNGLDLRIRVRSMEPASDTPLLYEHAIPYQHILSNNSILHCEFTLRYQEQEQLCVDFMQSAKDNFTDVAELVCQKFLIPTQPPMASSSEELSPTSNTTISMDRFGKYVNESCIVAEYVQLPQSTKRLICAALDPPRADERDWRLLAKKLSTDRYIAYFATKPSPTEQILNLWECRANSSDTNLSSNNAIMTLLMTLKQMGRQDLLDIIMETIGPLWI